jgi:hypothetical protein
LRDTTTPAAFFSVKSSYCASTQAKLPSANSLSVIRRELAISMPLEVC